MKDPSDTRKVRPRPGSPPWFFLTIVVIVGAGVLVTSEVMLRGLGEIVHHPMFWVVGAMILAGEIWRIALPGRSSQDSPAGSVAIAIAALFYWGLPVAAMLRVAAMAIVGVAQRKEPLRVAFNAAQVTLSLAATSAVLLAFDVRDNPHHPHPGHELAWLPHDSSLPVLVPAALAYFAVNFTLVTVAIALNDRKPIKDEIRASLRYKGVTHMVLFATAPLMTIVMEQNSALMVALFAFPLGAIYFGATASVQREYQATHDDLTGLLNRKLLAKRSAEALAKATAAGSKAGFLLIDLDRATGLKEVNDTLGHAVGDRLLQIVAHRLSTSVRPGDVVARLGGDEFAILLPRVNEAGQAREVASRLRAALAEPVRLEATMFQVEASVGIAIYPDDADGFEQLSQRADVAMYLAKERRSGIERYTAQADPNSAERLALLGDLRQAVHRGEIELYFQPKVLLADEHVIGMEALVRWRHPRCGTLLQAAEFVGLAEQSHLICELTEQVLDKALAQTARWREAGMPIQVGVNVPARDLISVRLPDLVRQALDRHGLPANALSLDISEQVLAGPSPQAAITVRTLAQLGVGISLDDFGTGYSSLSQLCRLGVSEVKLDPKLVSGLSDGQDPGLTVTSLVKLAQALGIRSIGEGVETAATAAALRLIGCDGAQGWYFARPLNATSATRWLSERLSPDEATPARYQLGAELAHRAPSVAEVTRQAGNTAQIDTLPGGQLARLTPGG